VHHTIVIQLGETTHTATHVSPTVPFCKQKRETIMMLGTATPATADAGLNLVHKG